LEIITKVDRKIASRDSTSVSVGLGFCSSRVIHMTKSAMCRYTKPIDPKRR